MGYTQFTATLPTRTKLRKTARWLRRLVDASEAGRSARRATGARALDAAVTYAANAAVAAVAVATFAAGGLAIALALGVVLARLPGHPVGLLAASAITTVALYTLPLLAVRAATRAARATE